MAKFMRVLRIDPLARVAVVQPGVRNAVVSELAAPYGLYYAPDPSSQIACTIGGNVSENSGGVHCLKYGLTLHNVLGMRGFTIDGEPIELGGEAPDAPGYDLLALAVGSEGMLMVVTEVTLKLLPKPQCARVIMASFDDVEKAGAAVADVIAAGIVPAGLEMMDRPATHAVEQFVHAGYDLQAAAILLCESDGTPEEVDDEIARMKAVLERAGATRMTVSRDEAERLRFWSGRKAAFPAVGRISPDYYCMDGTIPRKRLGEVLTFIAAMERKYGLRCPNVFHAGDGNLHPLILFDANDPDQLHRTEQFAGEVLEKCVEVGGTITGEHGVGVEKINQMCVQFGAPELELFHAVKGAFDPRGLLNPGKAVPTLARCAGVRRHARARRQAAARRAAALLIETLQHRIRDAASRRSALRLRGGGKDFYGNALRGEILDTRGYAGIVDYEPTELVVTAKCGTPLSELEKALAANHQILPFEPPHFGTDATVGGCIAAGLSGPRRASAGALRDFVLGVKLIDGRGQALSFGGRVMKNVAGYDVSRLIAGSLGTLGLIAEVSLKLSPAPPEERPAPRDLAGARARADEPLGRPAAADQRHGVARRRSHRAPVGRGGGGARRGRRDRRRDRRWCVLARRARAQRRVFGGDEPLWRLSLPLDLAAARARRAPADRMERRPALAEVGDAGERAARRSAPRERPRHPVPRPGQVRRLLRAARPGARAPAAAIERRSTRRASSTRAACWRSART